MEKLLFALLLNIIICQALIKQEPYNIKNKEATDPCYGGTPGGVSDCIDRKLYYNGKYRDHCCYIRYQLRGEMNADCIGINEEDYLDIVEYIRKMESGDKNLGSATRQVKIYDLNCFSSYIQIFGAYLLLALLF